MMGIVGDTLLDGVDLYGEEEPMMKRYDHDYVGGSSGTYSYMNESDTGEYCLYSDVAKLEAERDTAIKEMIKHAKEAGKLAAENDRLRDQYNELLYAVARKFPNETRHETALRYIRRAEESTDNIAKQAGEE